MSKGLQLHEYLMPHYFQHEHFKRCLFFTVLLRAELFTNNYISIFEYRSVEAAHPPQIRHFNSDKHHKGLPKID